MERPLLDIFQYPVSDRMGCNCFNCFARQLAIHLSVSCVGSNGLQPQPRRCDESPLDALKEREMCLKSLL